MSFFSKLNAAIETNHSLLCVGLDPVEANLLPGTDIGTRLVDWAGKLIEQTGDLVCCYKPNIAFYEQFGLKGLKALQDTLALIPQTIPVILDAKRGDIGSTAEAYATAVFEQWGADAVTLSPYLGEDSVAPFLARQGKAIFLLCHTSNPSAGQIQLHGKPPLYQWIAQTAQSWGSDDQIGFVVGATQPEALQHVRSICPSNWILEPGVGAQGGDLDQALNAGLRADGRGLIIPVSRGVLLADDPRMAAQALRERINAAVEAFKAAPRAQISGNDKLVRALFDAACIRFGQFTLASGKQSPVYIDLRRVVSFPMLFELVVEAYAQKAAALKFDHIAGVPYAALPTGAVVAYNLGCSMIYPRKEVKQHGTGQSIEGSFNPSQTAVLFEDVMTSGGSIITAAETLREAGLIVNDAVVLVDREQGGFAALVDHQIQPHPVMTFTEILQSLKRMALIDSDTYQMVRNYLDEQA